MPRERYFSVESLSRILCSVDEEVVIEALKVRLVRCPPKVDTRCLLLEFTEILIGTLMVVFKGFTLRLLETALFAIRKALKEYCG